MKSLRSLLFTLLAAGAVVATLAAFSPDRDATAPASTTVDARVERGRYLATRVGLCIDCHSGRNERGEWVDSQHLTGAAIPFAPSAPMPEWAVYAPRLAGLPAGYTEADVSHFLQTGERPHGMPPPRPPMPPYRMSRDDADAVAAYLHSLAPANP